MGFKVFACNLGIGVFLFWYLSTLSETQMIYLHGPIIRPSTVLSIRPIPYCMEVGPAKERNSLHKERILLPVILNSP